MKKLAVFASGNGSNFQAIAEEIQKGKIDAKVALVLTDKEGAGVIKRAEAFDLPVFCILPKQFETKVQYEQAILEKLKEYHVDYIILAGYMRLIGETLLGAFEDRIVNIHPSLLPSFPGKDAIGQAYRAGVKVTGVTVHFVDAGMDTGPIIDQEPIRVDEEETEETLAKKIHKVEHVLYPKVIQQLVSK
ncbi:phosphoribosylglycinamide formyltransferase [Metabacillus sp. HB246100]